MTRPCNLLVVSDLHFGEDLLPGTSVEKRDVVTLAARTFIDFLRHFAKRKEAGAPWRLVIAGDLFDFMSLVVPVTDRERTSDERQWGADRVGAASLQRWQLIAAAHRLVLQELGEFAKFGNFVEILAGNHDIELLEPAVAAAVVADIASACGDSTVHSRIRVLPWAYYEGQRVWIEHGHQHDEACCFETGLVPTRQTGKAAGRFLINADYAAVRYLATTAPALDAHGAEQWSMLGYLRYAAAHGGIIAFTRSYAHFAKSLFVARNHHSGLKEREARQQLHAKRLQAAAENIAVPAAKASALDRLARTPIARNWFRLIGLLAIDVFAIGLAALLALVVLLIFFPWWSVVPGAAAVGGVIWLLSKLLVSRVVASQLPMRAVPARIAAITEVPLVIFGHTHDPLIRQVADGVVYVNTGTWLPATRPGVLRSFSFVKMIVGKPVAMCRWQQGHAVQFDPNAEAAGLHS